MTDNTRMIDLETLERLPWEAARTRWGDILAAVARGERMEEERNLALAELEGLRQRCERQMEQLQHEDLPGIRLIEQERLAQIGKGFDAEHDDLHFQRELLDAASCHLAVSQVDDPSEFSDEPPMPENWPGWERAWKPTPDPIRNLIKAGALIAAAIDRLLRADEAFEQ